MTAVGALFDKAATTYDAERRLLVPRFDDFYGAAIEAIGMPTPGAKVLDIGAGTGLLSALVAARFPDCRLTLFDIAPAMLARARERFAAMGAAEPDLIVGDTGYGLPDGPFDAVISALSIHHLTDAAKQRCFGDIARLLHPGGVFVNAEQIAGDTPEESKQLDRDWEAEAIRLGATPQMIAAARDRMAHDICAPQDKQLRWMAEAGLTSPECCWRGGRFAVLKARSRPGNS
ncbi:MAG: class I SAM-dependent methyltransferase [Pseudomonadota bacterium]